jgi:hypothetical protein
VIAFGNLKLTLGLALFVFPSRPYGVAPGFIYIGLGLVCASILSKVLLLALAWRHQFALANWIPPIPIATCLVCLFTAAFRFQAEPTNSNFFTPVRVLIGLGAVCVTLFSIVEAGTSSSSETQTSRRVGPPSELNPAGHTGTARITGPARSLRRSNPLHERLPPTPRFRDSIKL